MKIRIRVDVQPHPQGSKVVLFPGDNQVCVNCGAPLDMAGQRAVSCDRDLIFGMEYYYELLDPPTCPGCGELLTHYRDGSMTSVHIKQLC